MTSLIGYVKNQPGFSEAKQIAILAAHGVKKIYVEGRGSETLESAARTLRENSLLACAGGYRPFGNSLKEIVATWKTIKRFNPVMINVETGERTDKDSEDMLGAAISKIHHEKTMPMPDQAKKMGRKGGKARAAKLVMTPAQLERARLMWFHQRYARDQHAADAIGKSKSFLFGKFGPSGRKQGRPPSID